jgi:hypothetical protein
MEDGDKVFSVDEAFLAVGFGKFQLLLLAYAGISSVAEAMEMMLLSFIGPAIHSKWDCLLIKKVCSRVQYLWV